MDAMPLKIITEEIQIVDNSGHPLIVLSGKSGKPAIIFLRRDGQQGLALSLDDADRPAIKLANTDATAPTASLEIDDKGAHVKFDRPGGASSYLFLNNAGGSGVVLIDAQGQRRVEILTAPDGTITVSRSGNKETLP